MSDSTPMERIAALARHITDSDADLEALSRDILSETALFVMPDASADGARTTRELAEHVMGYLEWHLECNCDMTTWLNVSPGLHNCRYGMAFELARRLGVPFDSVE